MMNLERLPGGDFITREGTVSFYHDDFYAQALAKIERGHAQDGRDVTSMLTERRVMPDRLRELFEAVAGDLYKYPAINPAAFRGALDAAFVSQ